jgi:hypothetical protein
VTVATAIRASRRGRREDDVHLGSGQETLGPRRKARSPSRELIGRSFQATNEAMKRLEAAGIVRQVNVGRRNRAFEAPAVIGAFTALERRLASSAGESRSVPPHRPTPARPR